MKKCPNCTSLMPEDVNRCIRCGFDSMPTDSLVSSLVAPNTKVEKKGRFRTGLTLTAQSFRVLMLDKSLLVFPLLSGAASFFVLASFIGGVWATGYKSHADPMGSAQWALLFAYYFASYFVIVFFNSALVACAMIRFRG